MNKWMTYVVQMRTVTATSKAYGEASEIAGKMGYRPLNLLAHNFNDASDVDLYTRIDGITAMVSRGDMVVYQYPTYCGGWFDSVFVWDLKMRGIRPVLFIQDVEKFRWAYDYDEMTYFNEFDVIIVLSEAMKVRLKEMGVKSTMIVKELWDFLVDEDDGKLENNLQKKLVFAGNLYKSQFLKNWDKSTELQVFGRKEDFELSPKVEYMGVYHQDELIRRMPKDRFGIAWDINIGDSPDVEKGPIYQDYTKYNCSYKVSLYLSLGIPVIVWKGSAISKVIEKYQVGFALDSLDEIDPLMARLTDADLTTLKKRVNRFSRSVRNGLFVRTVLMEAENQLLFDTIK